MTTSEPKAHRCQTRSRATSFSVLLALLALCACSGEKQPAAGTLSGDLEPVETALTSRSDYEDKLRQALMKKAPRSCELQFLVIASFQPEVLLSVYPVGDEYEAQVLTPVTQIWVTEGDAAAIELREAKKELPAPIAKRLSKVWKRMLGRTRYSEAAPTVLDGVAYTFVHYDRGAWVGESSNPRSGTRPYVLAEAGEALVAYVHAQPDEEQQLLAQVVDSLAQLEASLPK